MPSVRHALSLYARLLSVQIRSQLQYRLSFLLEVTSTAVTLGLFFLVLVFIFDRFGQLGGWSIAEVAFLFGMVETAFGIMDMVFSGFDPANFGQQVRRGTFDQLLLRPVDLTLQVLGSQFVLRRLGRILEGTTILIYALILLNIQWTVGKVLYLPIVLLSQVLFFGGLFMIGAAVTFWTVESIEVMNIFTYGGSELISYPAHIYQRWMRHFFTYIVPAIFLNYFPALYFLDKSAPFPIPNWVPFMAPLVGLAVLTMAFRFWRFGIRHYQSTGT
ncbi:MAG TPA: ABC-2 family transporter protein [Anaerolineae bacterium]